MDGEVLRKSPRNELVIVWQAIVAVNSGILGASVHGARTKLFKFEEASGILWLSMHLANSMGTQAKPAFGAAKYIRKCDSSEIPDISRGRA
jgi:hypothetical protein